MSKVVTIWSIPLKYKYTRITSNSSNLHMEPKMGPALSHRTGCLTSCYSNVLFIDCYKAGVMIDRRRSTYYWI